MRIWAGELKKICQRKVFLIFFAVLAALNVMLVYREIGGSDTGYDLRSLEKVYRELEKMTPEQRSEWADERFFQLQMCVQEEYYDDSGYPYTMYSDSLWQEIGLISYIKGQTDQWMDYASYLAGIEEQASVVRQLELFGGASAYEVRASGKTQEIYEALEGTEIQFDISAGIRLVTDWRQTDILILVLLVIFLLYLVWKEREENVLILIRTARYGRRELYAAKLLAFLAGAAGIVILFYGINLLEAVKFVGLGNPGRPIQSLDGYLASPFRITAGRYLLLFFLFKILAVWITGCVIFVICALLHELRQILLATGGIAAAQIVLWAVIPENSRMCVFHKVNLVSLLDTGGWFAFYSNMNVLGFPVSECTVNFVFFGAAAGALVVCGGYISALPAVSLGKAARSAGKRNRCPGTCLGTGLLRHEIYKIFCSCRGLLLLAVLALFCVGSSMNMKYYSTVEDYYYQGFSAHLSGSVSETGQTYLEEEKERIARMDQELLELQQKLESGEISMESFEARSAGVSVSVEERSALERAGIQYEYLMTGQSADREYIDQTGWEYLYGTANHESMEKYTLAALFFLILVLSPAIAGDYTSHVILVSRMAKKGRHTQRFCVCISGILFGIVLSAITYFPNFLWILQRFEMNCSSISAQSVMELSALGENLSLAGWWVVMAVWRGLGMILAALVVLFFSGVCRNSLGAMAFSSICLLLPLILHMLGVVESRGILQLLLGFYGV